MAGAVMAGAAGMTSSGLLPKRTSTRCARVSGPFGITATTGAIGAGGAAAGSAGVIAAGATAKGESTFTPLATSSETRLPSSTEKSVRELLISNLAPLARTSIEPSARTLETCRTVPTSSVRSWTFLPSTMTGTVVAVFTVTAVGQRMRYSEMDLKSMAGSAAATSGGAGVATGAAALGATLTAGMTTGAAATSSGLIAPGLRLTTTLKLGVRNRTPPAPTIAPKRKRRRPRKKAAMGVFRSPP